MADSDRFSPSRGWDDVRAILARDSRLIVPVAGAFFLLPTLVLSLVVPEIDAGSSMQEWIELLAPYAPLVLLVGIFQILGQLTILRLVLSTDRPTVAKALKDGARLTPFYFLVNLCVSLLLGLGVILLILPGLWLLARLFPVAALFVAEDQRWPAATIGRTFALTKGHALTIFAFFAIIFVIYMVLAMVVELVTGTLLGLGGVSTAHGEIGALLLAIPTDVIAVAFTVVLTLMQVAVYRRLSGTPSRAPR